MTPTGDIMVALTGYLLGCGNAAYYLVRFRTGQDIRSLASGTAGASNAGRILGSAGFVLAFLFDSLKGAGAIALGLWWPVSLPALALTLVAVVAGHIWPIQLRFRGGKGIATMTGALLVFDPFMALTQIGVFLVLWPLLRARTRAALFACLLLPLIAATWHRPPAAVLGAAAVGVLVVFAHRQDFRPAWHRESAPTVPAQSGESTR